MQEETQIVVELVFIFHPYNDSVDPVLAARISHAQIGRASPAEVARNSRDCCVERLGIDTVDHGPDRGIAGREQSLEENAARVDRDLRAAANAIDDACLGPAPVEKVEGKLKMAHIAAIERRERFIRRLHGDAKPEHRSVFKSFDQPFPHRAMEFRHVGRTMQQEAIDLLAPERIERLLDARIDGSADFAARSAGSQIGERTQFCDGADCLAGTQRFAETIFAVPIGASGIELCDAGVDRTVHQPQCCGSRGFPGPIGRPVGNAQLNRSQHQLRRARLAHDRTLLAPIARVACHGKQGLTTRAVSRLPRAFGWLLCRPLPSPMRAIP